MILNSKRKDSSGNYTRFACQNNIYRNWRTLRVCTSDAITGCILRRIGNKAEPEEETRRSAEICWEPRKPQRAEFERSLTRNLNYSLRKSVSTSNTLALIGIPMGHSPDISADYQTPPCTPGTMDNTFPATP